MKIILWVLTAVALVLVVAEQMVVAHWRITARRADVVVEPVEPPYAGRHRDDGDTVPIVARPAETALVRAYITGGAR
jgi:hypothetical protein